MQHNFTIINPYNNAVLDVVHYDHYDQVERKIARLKEGKHHQKALPAFKRADILFKLAGLLEERQEELAQIITQEMGKTINDSRGELIRAINTIWLSGEEARRLDGEVLDVDAFGPARHKMGIVCRRPAGIILCITPFNFPVNLAVHKIGPAFAVGNTILLKPNEQTYLSTLKLVELCYEAGIPEDMLQMTLPHIEVMPQLNAHPEIDIISFTGGTKTASAIAKDSGSKKLLLELGGNDPLIVMPDADISLAVKTAIQHRFGVAGQRCTASKRLFLHAEIYDAFREALIAQTKALKIGDPMQEETFIGPVVSEKAADMTLKAIEIALSEGATLTVGNKREGNIISPTILENIHQNHTLMREEIFGPVLPLYKFESFDEIIPVINQSPYGLQAGLFSNQLDLIKKAFNMLEVGSLIINDGPGFRADHLPFGGVKQSGLGREGVKYTIREMSILKTLIF
ncbi:MAG: aldehyde dehydrogenase family protein [Pseudomonadota bacterium]